MITPEERTKEKLLKKIIGYSLFGVTFAIFSSLIDVLLFRNAYVYFAFIYGLITFGAMWTNYYITFKRQFLPLRYSIFNLVASTLITVTVLTYMSGGFSGAMVSAFFMGIVIYSLLLEKNEAILLSLLVVIIYLMFFVGEISGVLIPLVNDRNVINYSKAVIDMLSFIVVTFLGTIVSENARNSLKYYALRSVRLSNIRKRLEFLVKKRTNQLENTNRKLRKAEAEISRDYKELKALDLQKDEFISIAAHELKTPLTAIGGYAQLLKENKIIRDPKKRGMFLQILDEESRRLSELVTDILNLSRIDLGVMKYNIEEVDLYELIKFVDNEFNPKFKKSGLKHELVVYKGLPTIHTDKSKVYEVMTNLISNAIKYTQKGRITMKVERKGGFIQFSVEDTGIGIARKDYSKLFKRFSQIDSSVTREYRGSGLGLSICKEFVMNLGGKIWFRSKVGRGSTFYFKVPIVSKIKMLPPVSK